MHKVDIVVTTVLMFGELLAWVPKPEDRSRSSVLRCSANSQPIVPFRKRHITPPSDAEDIEDFLFSTRRNNMAWTLFQPKSSTLEDKLTLGDLETVFPADDILV